MVALVGLAGCVFTGAETEGLPCNGNGECGPGLRCVERVCCPSDQPCGPEAATGTGDETETDAETAVAPGEDEAVRESCEASETTCLDEHVIRFCTDDGKLTTYDCRAACGEWVESLGCHYIVSEDRDSCVCGFEIEACSSPGALACDGVGGLQSCTDDEWVHLDCDDVCIELDYGGAAYCDTGICYCDDVCQDETLRCTDSNTNAICFDGVWYPESCTTVCRDNGWDESLGCFYYPGDDSYCMCL